MIYFSTKINIMIIFKSLNYYYSWREKSPLNFQSADIWLFGTKTGCQHSNRL